MPNGERMARKSSICYHTRWTLSYSAILPVCQSAASESGTVLEQGDYYVIMSTWGYSTFLYLCTLYENYLLKWERGDQHPSYSVLFIETWNIKRRIRIHKAVFKMDQKRSLQSRDSSLIITAETCHTRKDRAALSGSLKVGWRVIELWILKWLLHQALCWWKVSEEPEPHLLVAMFSLVKEDFFLFLVNCSYSQG